MSLIAWIILGVLGMPFLVYFCVKLGTVAFYRGRREYQRFEIKERTNGEETKK